MSQPEMRPARVLDLYCGQGGAAVGYDRAGFEVVGVDIKPQPRYPFEFVQGDAITFLHWLLFDGRPFLQGLDLIHASPPCQLWSIQSKCRPGLADSYPDLIGPTRELLEDTGVPYVIENVPGAPLLDPIELCGCMFGMRLQYKGKEFALYRPRLFESSFPLLAPEHSPHDLPACPVTGNGSPGWFYKKHGFAVLADGQRELMGTEWMTLAGTVESIPPIFTEFIGIQARALVKRLHKQDVTEAA